MFSKDRGIFSPSGTEKLKPSAYKKNGVWGHDSTLYGYTGQGATGANEINFVMNHAPELLDLLTGSPAPFRWTMDIQDPPTPTPFYLENKKTNSWEYSILKDKFWA